MFVNRLEGRNYCGMNWRPIERRDAKVKRQTAGYFHFSNDSNYFSSASQCVKSGLVFLCSPSQFPVLFPPLAPVVCRLPKVFVLILIWRESDSIVHINHIGNQFMYSLTYFHSQMWETYTSAITCKCLNYECLDDAQLWDFVPSQATVLCEITLVKSDGCREKVTQCRIQTRKRSVFIRLKQVLQVGGVLVHKLSRFFFSRLSHLQVHLMTDMLLTNSAGYSKGTLPYEIM